MANYLGVKDAYAIMNNLAKQALGTNAISVVDTSTFVSVGETLLQLGNETLLNAISYAMAKTIFSIRPYRAKLASLVRDEERFGMITRKITYLSMELEATQDYNTDLNPDQLADGNSIDMYKIAKPKDVQLNFPGAQAMQAHITRFRDQLALAFSNEAELIRFWEGAMVAFYNDIETVKEARSRLVLINYMAGMVDMGLNVVDLAAGFNAENGTSYTRAQLLSTYAEEFSKYMAAEVQIWSDRLTDRSVSYHANLTGYAPIPRHTPKDRQRMIMYGPLFTKEKANVFSSLFNPQYLNIGDFESVNYWQSQESPTQIQVTPNVLDVATGQSKTGNAVTIPYAVGLLYDEEALGVMAKFEYASATPFNSAGGYFNLFLHWLFKMYADYTENAVLFVIGDGGAAAANLSATKAATK